MNPYRVVAGANASKIKTWMAERGGIAIWTSINLSNPGGSWTTPLYQEDGRPSTKPTWQAAEVPSRIITDPAEIVVDEPREVKRFRVGVRRGSNNPFLLKVTDAGSQRIRRETDKAGAESWYEFDYSTQEAVIYIPGHTVPLVDWTPDFSVDDRVTT